MRPFITVTGADERTSLSLLRHRVDEVGLLYTATPEGRNRYPSKEWIRYAAENLPQVSIHICGRGARGELMTQQLDGLIENAQRIQVNGVLTIADCERICTMNPEKTIITQHNPDNKYLLAVKAPNHALLVDSSGGRGMTPGVWRKPDTKKQVGYAGGLGPDNLDFELRRIRSIADGEWWVDMEGKLRENDWFSVERALECVLRFHSAFIECPTKEELKAGRTKDGFACGVAERVE